MSRFGIASLSLAAMTLFAVVPTVQADLVTEVTKFNGTVTDVGVVRGPGQIGGVEYRIRGRFSHVPIDLTDSTFTIEQAFVEPDSTPGAGDGAGELMRALQGDGGPETDLPLVPITMPANHAEFDEAKYDTPGTFRPQIRVKVEEKNDTEFRFDVRLDRGLMRERPNRCTLESDGRVRTLITHSFTITDASIPPRYTPLTVTFTKKWECPKPDRYHMRSR